MSDVTVTVLDPSTELPLRRLAGAFLVGYRNANTRTAYLQLHRWFAWCTAHQLDPLDIERTQGRAVPALVRTPSQLDQHCLSRDETPRQIRLTRHELGDWTSPLARHRLIGHR